MFNHTRTSPMPVLLPRREALVRQQTHHIVAGSATPQPASIYAVDEVPGLTELYTSLLGEVGYVARTFNHRAKALAALKTASRKPALLITNYRGSSMSISDFIRTCRCIHPRLRILMASGFAQSEMKLFGVKPDRFIEKPFTPNEFHEAVKSVLDAD